MDLKEEALLGPAIEGHWYYQAKARAVSHLLESVSPRILLDVGAGSGFFSRHLLKTTEAVKAFCIDHSYPEDREDSVAGKPLHFQRTTGPLKANLMLLMDVLEHVDDDLGLLKEYLEKIPPDGYVLISVPAFMSLWSVHDVFLEHRRRYTLREIETIARKAGLEIQTGCYFFALVFPLAWITRRFHPFNPRSDQATSQLRAHHPLVNAWLRWMCRLELPWMTSNRLLGLTAFVLARKPRS